MLMTPSYMNPGVFGDNEGDLEQPRLHRVLAVLNATGYQPYLELWTVEYCDCPR